MESSWVGPTGGICGDLASWTERWWPLGVRDTTGRPTHTSPCGRLPPLHRKVEVFEYALDSTSGEDLHRVLWLKSRNSEVWLDRRTTYTRSTAVMSMTGYLLGGWLGI